MNPNTEYSTILAPLDNIGWHLRPVGLLVQVARMFESEIVVKFGNRVASAKSILGLLTLEAGGGARLYVSARGRDARVAIKAIKRKFAQTQRHLTLSRRHSPSSTIIVKVCAYHQLPR